jgi:hypothetical protein
MTHIDTDHATWQMTPPANLPPGYTFTATPPSPVYPRGYPLLVVALAAITRYPDHHYQGTWSCETGMCAAGWIGTLGGAKFSVLGRTDMHIDGKTEPAPAIATKMLGFTGAARVDDWINTDCRDCSERRRELVSLADRREHDMVQSLFGGGNDIDDIYRAGADLFEIPETRLRDDVKLILDCAPPADAFEMVYGDYEGYLG